MDEAFDLAYGGRESLLGDRAGIGIECTEGDGEVSLEEARVPGTAGICSSLGMSDARRFIFSCMAVLMLVFGCDFLGANRRTLMRVGLQLGQTSFRLLAVSTVPYSISSSGSSLDSY